MLVFFYSYVIILNKIFCYGGINMIQPIDIKTHKFKKGILGYKSADVDSFIDSVYRAYEDIFYGKRKAFQGFGEAERFPSGQPFKNV